MGEGAPYLPSSPFLQAILAEELSLSDGDSAEANLRELIALTRDTEVSNRDWAALLLAQQDINTPEVREALLRAAADNNGVVQGEAMLGLAMRDPGLALPLVQAALAGDRVNPPTLEAALLCAHPSLVEDLRVWAEPSDMPDIDALAAEALAACEAAGD